MAAAAAMSLPQAIFSQHQQQQQHPVTAAATHQQQLPSSVHQQLPSHIVQQQLQKQHQQQTQTQKQRPNYPSRVSPALVCFTIHELTVSFLERTHRNVRKFGVVSND